MYRKNRRLKDFLRHSRKTLVMMMAMVIALSGAIGGTLAWLMDQTQTIKNTFTVGDINIKLEESDADGDQDPDNNDYEMIPGETISKDPKVTVLAGSKACWLYVRMEKSANFDKYLSYSMADGWTALEGVSGVYYRSVDAAETDIAFSVLKNDQVTVHATADLSALIEGTETLPTLSITAYAVQRDAAIEQVSSAAKAWELVIPQVNATPTPAPSPAAELTKAEEQAVAWKAFLDSNPDND